MTTSVIGNRGPLKKEKVVACAESEQGLETAVGILRDLIASEALLNAMKGDRDEE